MSSADLRQLMQYILSTAQKHGATDASVAVNQDSGFSVDVRMGDVETVAFSEDQGISVTVHIGLRKGSASSTDRSTAAIDAMVVAACDIARVSAEDPCSGLAESHLINNNYPVLDLYYPWSVSPTEAIQMALACEQYALAQDNRITNSDGVNIATYTFNHGYANTHGCENIVKSSRHSISCSLIAQDKGSMQRDYDYSTVRHPSDLLDFELLAASAANRAVSRLGAKKIKTQKAPIIFSSRLSSSLFSNFITAISGSNLYRKNSFLLDSVGSRLFPVGTKIYEQPSLLRGLGSAPIDGDGVPTRHNTIVDNGELKQYVLGCYSARKLGLTTTANSGGVFNLTVDASAGDLTSLLQRMKNGLLVTELMGHGVNGLTGDYSRGASGFWIENGEIAYPVEEITIAGNLKDMFANILAIGSDLNPNSSTRCGSVLVAEMMIAGY
ncbi:MAG: metalloprotease PmbA [Legionella sp.]